MSEVHSTVQLNHQKVFEALGVNMSGVSEERQTRIASLLASSARSLKHAIKGHEKGISIESQLAATLSLTSEQASLSCAPFYQILQDDLKKKKSNIKESDESSSESDKSSSSDEKSSSSSESDDYISLAEKQVPITCRISKYQGKFIQIPFDLTGATGVTQVGNLITMNTSQGYTIFLNRMFNEGIWRIYFQFLKNNSSWAIGASEPSYVGSSNNMGNDRFSMDYNSGGGIFQNGNSTNGNKSYSTNDIIGLEVDMNA
ncbi:MAG: hypothetical protein EZS28_019829 [Streblomastix strix]|uniref:Uncharacterized protein n=1 Tax=Streblomastix strix TaxID=222440 RepID=A0A5J4VQ75_9EUKA|nr:MAG: hypothetical protein EZS28_019829 [Streblomastix strix]